MPSVDTPVGDDGLVVDVVAEQVANCDWQPA
jgi:hypothetical protein